MKKLNFTLDVLSIATFGMGVIFFFTNNVSDAIYFTTLGIFAKVWSIEGGNKDV